MDKKNLNNLYEPLETTNFGFNVFSEKLNGRAAMLGIFLIFFIEVFTKKNILAFFIG